MTEVTAVTVWSRLANTKSTLGVSFGHGPVTVWSRPFAAQSLQRAMVGMSCLTVNQQRMSSHVSCSFQISWGILTKGVRPVVLIVTCACNATSCNELSTHGFLSHLWRSKWFPKVLQGLRNSAIFKPRVIALAIHHNAVLQKG